MESSPLNSPNLTVVHTPPVHTLLRSSALGWTLQVALSSVARRALSDECIGCFAQYNCQSVLKLPQAQRATYRETRGPVSEHDPHNESLGSTAASPLVVLSLFIGLRTEDAPPEWFFEPTPAEPKPLGRLMVVPFAWPRAAETPWTGHDTSTRNFSYACRIDLHWLTETECQISMSSESSALSPLIPFPEFCAEWSRSLAPLESQDLEAQDLMPQHLGPLASHPPVARPEFSFASDVRERLKASMTRLQTEMTKGNCYLANLTERIAVDPQRCARTFAEFLARWGQEPSRFGWFLRSKEVGVESYSPERFFSIQGSTLLSEPIKGTRTVAGDSHRHDQEQRVAQELWSSEKERCEQHLVTDLIRNDLAPLCVPGSIHVTSPLEIRFCSGLAQMTSVIRGTLRPTLRLETLLKTALPAGSVTGSPKWACSRFLRELEPQPRGLYCGLAIDLRSQDSVEATLLIRSLFRQGDDAYAAAGAGITTLSNPEEEVQEIETKLRSFLKRYAPAGDTR